MQKSNNGANPAAQYLVNVFFALDASYKAIIVFFQKKKTGYG